MLIEIHMLKNYPATNLNRDDMGAPKNCIFGGIQRGRISSQCLKRSWRISPLFQKDMAGHLGTRTRKMPQLVAEKLKEMGIAEEYLPADYIFKSRKYHVTYGKEEYADLKNHKVETSIYFKCLSKTNNT